MPVIFKIGEDGETLQKYESSSYREAEAAAVEADKKLSAYDFKHDEWVLAIHEEGTQFLFRHAFVREWKDWVFIFTEHHRTHVYHKTDLRYYGHLKQMPTQTLKGTGAKDNCFDCKQEFDIDSLSYKPHPAKHDPDFIVPLCEKCFDSAEEYSAECDK